MTTSAIITVLAIAALVLFAVWALLPTMTANRRRILRSPATWALVVLALSWLFVQWNARREAREIENLNLAIDIQRQIQDEQQARNQKIIRKQMEETIKRAEQENGR